MAIASKRLYDCEILYHPGKANVVADTLSRKSMSALFVKPSIESTLKTAQIQEPQLEKIRANFIKPKP